MWQTEARSERKWQFCQNGNSGGNDCPGGDNAGGSDEKACYHGGIPGHIRPDCIHYKRAKETRNTVRKGTASIDTAGDRDPLWLSGNALTTSSAHTTWVIDPMASHHVCNNCSLFKSFNKLRRTMLIELGDDNTVSVTHHGLVDATQGYEIDALYTPTFCLWLFSINQLGSTGSTATFGGGKCSLSSPQSQITITGHHVNDLYFISPNVASPHTATSDGLPSMPSNIDSSIISKSKSKSTWRKRTRSTLTTESTSPSPTSPPSAPPNSSPSTHAISSLNAPWSALISISPSTPATSSPNAPTTTSRSPPITATKSKSTWKTLTISQSRPWHRRLAHIQPASMQSLIPEYRNNDLMCTVCIQAKHKLKFIRVKVKRTSKPFWAGTLRCMWSILYSHLRRQQAFHTIRWRLYPLHICMDAPRYEVGNLHHRLQGLWGPSHYFGLSDQTVSVR